MNSFSLTCAPDRYRRGSAEHLAWSGVERFRRRLKLTIRARAQQATQLPSDTKEDENGRHDHRRAPCSRPEPAAIGGDSEGETEISALLGSETEISALGKPNWIGRRLMSTEQGTQLRQAPRVIFGVVLFIAWGIETVLWVATTVDLATKGQVTPVITAAAAVALMILLAGMEGLEVSVIDRWRVLYPDRTTSQLAAWLAARQLFVALIVTTATLLAHRSEIYVPGDGRVTGGLLLGLFDLTWTGLTVLWFAQIFPKHLAATNPDRYLEYLRGLLFPIVEVVRRIGVSQPGEWVASGVESRLSWKPTASEVPEALPPEESIGTIWRALIPGTEGPMRTSGPQELADSGAADEERFE